jgi:hypothetical protein
MSGAQDTAVGNAKGADAKDAKAGTSKAAVDTANEASVAKVAQALEIFFQLGLPDTKTAKWVHVDGAGISQGMRNPYAEEPEELGNAWLLREEADGTVELVVNHTRVLKAKKVGKGGRGKPGELPTVQIKPADLAADLKKLVQGWKAYAQQMHSSRPGSDDEEEDEGSNFGGGSQSLGGIASQALLFAAHLQRQGKADAVKTVLPPVLKMSGSAEAALNGAVSMLGDARLAALTEQWARQGDAKLYAEGIDKLAEEFSRGWANRAAALLLVERARKQTPAEGAEDPRAKAAAALLLGLRAEQFRDLPMNYNWLLMKAEEAESAGMSGGWQNYPSLSGAGDEDESSSDDEEEGDENVKPKRGAKPGPGGKASPTKAFFAKPREAAQALALLLGDHRLLRSAGRIRRDSSSWSSEESPEILLKKQYAALPRPTELGELAKALLAKLLPGNLSEDEDDNEAGESSGEAAREWVESIAKLSDEDLAWNYLKSSGSSSNAEFGSALTYLVEKGSAATLVKLQDVFQDPAVWHGNFDGTLEHLEGYMKKVPGDKAAFGEKLKAAAKLALEEERAEQGKYQSQMPAEYAKMQQAQEKAQLKKIEQFFKQSNLAVALADILEAEEAEAQALAQSLQPIIARTPPGEVETQLLQAAVQAKTYGAKSALLMVLHGRGETRGAAAKKPEAMSAAARAAALVLMADETKPSAKARLRGEEITVGLMASQAIVFSRFTPEEQAVWMHLYQTVPQLVPGWIRAAAQEVVAGKPIPPAPDAAHVPEAQVTALVAELGALAADKLAAGVQAKTPDQQLALLTYLEGPKAVWPATFKAAYLQIGEVTGELAGALGLEKWKGRQLDDALLAEMSAAVEKTVLDGKATIVTISPKGLLSGLTLNVMKNPQTITRQQFASYPLKMPADKPAPDGFAAHYLQGGPVDRQMGGLGYFYPVWKDAATTKAWQEENRKQYAASGKGGEKPAPGRREFRNDPAPLEKTLKAVVDLEPAGRKTFQIRWMSAQIVEKKAPGGDEEPPDE